jgi:hypothetical protein
VSPRFSLRSISNRVRWSFVLRVALSGPSRCCHRPVSRRCFPGPSRSGPPRCCADLRRLTTRRSRCLGLAAPPASLASRPGPWRVPPGRQPGCFQSSRGTTRDLALTLEDLVRAPVRRSRSADDCRSFAPSLLPWDFPPLRCSQPEESTSRHGVVPRGRPAALTVGPAPVVPPSLTRGWFHRASSRVSTPASFRLRRFPRP